MEEEPEILKEEVISAIKTMSDGKAEELKASGESSQTLQPNLE